MLAVSPETRDISKLTSIFLLVLARNERGPKTTGMLEGWAAIMGQSAMYDSSTLRRGSPVGPDVDSNSKVLPFYTKYALNLQVSSQVHQRSKDNIERVSRRLLHGTWYTWLLLAGRRHIQQLRLVMFQFLAVEGRAAIAKMT